MRPIKSECNHGTLKKCVKLESKDITFPGIDDYPYRSIYFYMCDKCKKEFNVIESVDKSDIEPKFYDFTKLKDSNCFDS